jgi:hypothetical protein
MPKPTQHDPRGHVESGNGREARHVFVGRSEVRLVAAQKDVRSAVDEHDRVEVERLHQVRVALLHGATPNLANA